MRLFYRQPSVQYFRCLPVFPIPGSSDAGGPPGDSPGAQEKARYSLAETFPFLCQFWRIMHDVAVAYYGTGSTEASSEVPIYFAEYKFRELLALVENLPSGLLRAENNPHHIVIFHIWLHAAILDIFRPFMQTGKEKHQLKTFSSAASTPEAVYSASVRQLKRLILTFRYGYKSSEYTVVWHTALLYVANAVLQATEDKDWLFYFLVCLYGYNELRQSYPMTEAIAKALLSMAMRDGSISNDVAMSVLKDLNTNQQADGAEGTGATLTADVDPAMSDTEAATAEGLAGCFDENVMIMAYTNIFERGQ